MTNKSYNFQKLTPIRDADLSIYKNALDFVFENSDIKNVAISGAYSAGKSSIVESYKKLNPDTKFMHISLSFFQPGSDSDRQPNEQSENVLEGKILNQLIHQIEPTQIPQTNFRVKRQLSPYKLRLSAFMVSLFILLFLYLFNFSKWGDFVNSLTVGRLREDLLLTTTSQTAFFVGVICVIILSYLIHEIIKIQFNKNIFKGISVQGNTIEIFEQSEESYFDKYLNEVLYLFENSDMDVIVFEDMDRYNTNQVFQRLREINTLINSRKKNSDKQLRFFYLLRDDIFISKERTKFFDFIIPIIPILDGSNSFDQFIAHFKDGDIFYLFKEHFLQEISLYIDDMRILKNIYNEFLIYYERISTTEQDPNKLLAIVIYKNIFPRDFSNLQLNSGYVYTLFSKKDDFIKDEIVSLRQGINQIEGKIESAENEHLKSVEEINSLYDPQIRQLSGHYNKTKRDALNDEKSVRIENLENKTTERKDALNQEISMLESSITLLQHKKIHEIINKKNEKQIFKVTYINEIGEESNFNDIKGSDYFPLIKYLIRNGYIDETYPDYMTYFYEHSLSRIDKIFLRSVTDEDARDYAYQLKDPKKVVTRLSLASFDKEEVLNFDLLDYLLEHQSGTNKRKMLKILLQLKYEKNFKFISLYFESQKNIAPFIKELNSIWTEAFSIILAESNFTEEQKKLYALESIYHTTSKDLEKVNSEDKILTDFISARKDFLEIVEPDIMHLIDSFELLNVKFLEIDYEVSNKELFKAVYHHNFYIISFELVCLMLKKIYGLPESSEFRHKNYTLILSKADEILVDYVEEHINDYISEVLRHCGSEICDSEEAVIKLLNNETLEEQLKSNYMDNLETSISILQDINDFTLWAKLFNYNLVVYSENNVLQYFFNSGNGLDKTLANFINNKGDSFNFIYSKIEDEFEEDSGLKFFNAVVKSEELSLKTYTNILKSLNRIYSSFGIKEISDSKIEILIDQGIITMIPEVLLFMREHYPQNTMNFIKRNIHEYTKEVISEENFDFDEMCKILEMDVDDKYKISLMEYTDNPISVIDNVYSDVVKAYILENNFDNNDIPSLFEAYTSYIEEIQIIVEDIARNNIEEIIENEYFVPIDLSKKLFASTSLSSEDRLQLFAVAVKDFDEIECKSCLEILNRKDLLSTFHGKRPAMPITNSNKKILDIFVRKNWIVRYKVDDNDENMYRVSSKRPKKRKF